jgi:hypothetical protein
LPVQRALFWPPVSLNDFQVLIGLPPKGANRRLRFRHLTA